jgi:hypothetical protein
MTAAKKKTTTITDRNKDWYEFVDGLVKKYTGWDSLKKMCLNSPTLRVSKHTSKNEAEAICIMRQAYKTLTGKEAYPQENWDERKRR